MHLRRPARTAHGEPRHTLHGALEERGGAGRPLLLRSLPPRPALGTPPWSRRDFHRPVEPIILERVSTRRFDALIVGGGPAGSLLARLLTRAGWRVAILDRAQFPREKLCGGWITPEVWSLLEIPPEVYPKELVLQKFRGFRVEHLGRGEGTVVGGETVLSYGIVRREFDHWLLRQSGATIFQGQGVRRIERRHETWYINDQFEASILVGAGGYQCPVARLLGNLPRTEKKLSTLELEVPLGKAELDRLEINPEIPEVYYSRDLRGYGWCFRKDPYLNVGIGRTLHAELRRHLADFLELLEKRGRIPPGAARSWEPRFRGWAYKLHFVTPRKVYGEGVLLVGDAAGLALNYSGEGIRPALISARLAAEVLTASADQGPEQLATYQERLWEALGRPVTGWRFRLMESLPPACFQTIGKWILASPERTRRFFVRWFLRPGLGLPESGSGGRAGEPLPQSLDEAGHPR